jgi:hypothetical protein
LDQYVEPLNQALASYANVASVASVLFSLASFVGVLLVRHTVKTAVTRQGVVLTSLRASNECRQLLVILSGLRLSVLASDWNAVLIRAPDARRSAFDLSELTHGLESHSNVAAGVVTQMRTLERSATMAVRGTSSPDVLRVVNVISKQEDAVQSISSALERIVKQQHER